MSKQYWVEEGDRDRGVTVPDDVVDLTFRVDGKQLPIDHAYALQEAVLAELPWLVNEAEAAIHQIHVAASGNGWYRPEDKEHEVLQVSRRTTFTLRLPTRRVVDAELIANRPLNIDGHEIRLTSPKTKPLSNLTTLFSRYVVGPPDETEFLDMVYDELVAKNIRVRKLLCGRQNSIKIPEQELVTRSIMLAELDLVESIQLQRGGLGPYRLLGCGIMIPHKGIEAVKKLNKD